MKHKTPLFRRVMGLVLVLAVLLPLGPSAIPGSEASQAKIDALKGDANSIAAQRKDIQAQIKAIQADKNAALQQRELLEQQIYLVQQEINNINEQIAMYDQLIAQKSEELAQAEADEAAQFDLFCRRMRSMEEEGETSYWSILFSSNDFSELLDNYMMVEEIIEYDNRIIDDLTALQEKVSAERTALEQAQAEQEAAKEQQEAARAELKTQEGEMDKLIQEINDREDELEAKEKDLRVSANKIDSEIKRLEREMAAQISKVVSESGFLWPLSANINTLSSLYGNRKDPINGRSDNHTGIDIPAASGTPIYAAKSGVVVTSVLGSGSYWSYGNFVLISHSDGTSTLYAHMSRRNASKGQVVKQGDVIGYVGTTGRSTGNHLHFEVRVNGSRTDPVNYFKDKTLYYRSGGKTVVLPH
ncbi:MAG: peptidoglycan DD-metalloendopeptidase family protein [Lawsonibacter sp.]|nr:peptidoglycan DD-metalloendopeptidase family protein [Lawsonibacter sp.]